MYCYRVQGDTASITQPKAGMYAVLNIGGREILVKFTRKLPYTLPHPPLARHNALDSDHPSATADSNLGTPIAASKRGAAVNSEPPKVLYLDPNVPCPSKLSVNSSFTLFVGQDHFLVQVVVLLFRGTTSVSAGEEPLTSFYVDVESDPAQVPFTPASHDDARPTQSFQHYLPTPSTDADATRNAHATPDATYASSAPHSTGRSPITQTEAGPSTTTNAQPHSGSTTRAHDDYRSVPSSPIQRPTSPPVQNHHSNPSLAATVHLSPLSLSTPLRFAAFSDASGTNTQRITHGGPLSPGERVAFGSTAPPKRARDFPQSIGAFLAKGGEEGELGDSVLFASGHNRHPSTMATQHGQGQNQTWDSHRPVTLTNGTRKASRKPVKVLSSDKYLPGLNEGVTMTMTVTLSPGIARERQTLGLVDEDVVSKSTPLPGSPSWDRQKPTSTRRSNARPESKNPNLTQPSTASHPPTSYPPRPSNPTARSDDKSNSIQVDYYTLSNPASPKSRLVEIPYDPSNAASHHNSQPRPTTHKDLNHPLPRLPSRTSSVVSGASSIVDLPRSSASSSPLSTATSYGKWIATRTSSRAVPVKEVLARTPVLVPGLDITATSGGGSTSRQASFCPGVDHNLIGDGMYSIPSNLHAIHSPKYPSTFEGRGYDSGASRGRKSELRESAEHGYSPSRADLEKRVLKPSVKPPVPPRDLQTPLGNAGRGPPKF